MGLTDTAIKRSRPAEKPYKLADGKGLYLLVNPKSSALMIRLAAMKEGLVGSEGLEPPTSCL